MTSNHKDEDASDTCDIVNNIDRECFLQFGGINLSVQGRKDKLKQNDVTFILAFHIKNVSKIAND